MRIEIDTKHDTKEELAHLANMLRAIAGSSSSALSSGSVIDSRIERKLARKGLVDSGPSGPQSSGGIFSLFDDGPSQNASEPASESSSEGGLFSLFSSSPGGQPSAPALQQEASPSQPSSVFDILNSPSSAPVESYGDAPEMSDDEGKSPSSVKDILEDSRIVPY